MPDDRRMTVSRMILNEQRELHRKQDDQLRSWKNVSRGMPLAVISAGTIVIAAAGDFSDAYAAVVLICASMLVALTLAAELFALPWRPGADIDDLEECSKEAKSDADALARRTVATSADHYKQNKRRLTNVKGVCSVQAAVALASAAILTYGIVTLPSNSARQQDRLDQQAEVLNKLVVAVSQELTRLEAEIQSLSDELDDLSGKR